MSTKQSSQQNADDREIVITRDFNAPRELVWEAMTNPKHVVNWWGPRGFSTTIETMDFRVGGDWKHVMRGPDGAKYPNHSVFKEIVKPERIVYTCSGHCEGGPGVCFESTWSFEAPASDKTRVTIRMVFPSATERDLVVKEFGAIEGGKQTLERLGEFLAGRSANTLIITRKFAAPRELVFKAWTTAEVVRNWWGCKEFPAGHMEMDARPGGAWRGCLRADDGREIWLGGKFIEIIRPERLVFTFVREAAPAIGVEPVDTRVTLTFAEDEGKTLMQFRQEFFVSAELRDDHGNGWSTSLARLDEMFAAQEVMSTA
jgi:uncharacterized protein YndB with AHSA1/START domain